jgi:hypothetical protein
MRIRALALLATLLLPLPLLAQTYNYTYTGNDFVNDAPYSVVYAPYTTSDFVTVTFTLSTPLADNLTGNSGFGATIFPLTWSFSDGVQTDTSADLSADSDFYLDTNGSGTIVDWQVLDTFGVGFSSQIQTIFETQLAYSYNYDYGYNSPRNGANLTSGEGSEIYNPGLWTVSESVSSVPEGSSFPLLLLSGACLCGVVFFRFRKRLGAGGGA